MSRYEIPTPKAVTDVRVSDDWVIPEIDWAVPARRQPIATVVVGTVGSRSAAGREQSRSRRLQRRRRIDEQLRRRPTLMVERFPVTILLGLQYGALVMFPALAYGTQPERLMLAVCGAAVGIALAIESLLAWVPPRATSSTPVGITRRSATAVLAVGMLAQVSLVIVGNTSYGAVATGQGQSHLAAMLTPFSPWLTFGAVMFLWLWRKGEATRTEAWIVLAFAESLQLLLLVKTGRTASLASFALTIALVAVLMRFVRLRWLVLAVALIPLVWPPLYQLRNDIRHTQARDLQCDGTGAGVPAPSGGSQLRPHRATAGDPGPFHPARPLDRAPVRPVAQVPRLRPVESADRQRNQRGGRRCQHVCGDIDDAG